MATVKSQQTSIQLLGRNLLETTCFNTLLEYVVSFNRFLNVKTLLVLHFQQGVGARRQGAVRVHFQT